MGNSNDQFNERELSVLVRSLQLVLDSSVPGDIVELGCYKGMTSLRIEQVLRGQRNLYVYDSFAGLPPKTTQDRSPAGMQFVEGELPASKSDVIKLFKKAGLRLPKIKKAWFYDLRPEDLPDEIAFAFLDGDFHESILDSLNIVWPKLSNGAIIVVDDYQNEALPGAHKAVDEWLKTHKANLKVEQSLAVIRPIID